MVSRNSGLKFDFCPENVSILFFQMIVYFVFLRKKSVNKFEPFEELIFLVSVPVCTLKFQKCPIPKILIGLTFYRFLSLRFSEFLSHYSAIYNSEKLKGSSVILKKFNCSNSHNFGQNQNA